MLFLLPLLISQSLPVIGIVKDNTVVSTSVRLRPGLYVVRDSDRNGVIQIGADNVTIDFQGAELRSVADPTSANRDQFEGTGIAINGHRNVTIMNAKIQGYRWNVRAVNAPGLKLNRCDVSFSRSIRIAHDGVPVDLFLDLRNVESWRRYGAGAWLERCNAADVAKVKSGGAQNGIVLVDSNGCRIVDNDVSFNSGWGIAFNGSSDNLAAWNLIDFGNRPWSGGWGGDAAGFAVANGCHRNLIVGNSMTHGGDGFFLSDRYNGRFNEPSGTFEGSCDDNVVANNDGSWAPANAFEATFSYRNTFYKNLADESGYGFWLGYSCDNWILDNDIRRNRTEGIAIEHGQRNLIERNRLKENGEIGIHLWAVAGRRHPSSDFVIRGNSIEASKLAIALGNSSGYSVSGNTLRNAPLPSDVVLDGPMPLSIRPMPTLGKSYRDALALRPKDFVFYRDTVFPKGLEWIRADEFAPHDFRNDLVAWRRIDDHTLELHPIGSHAKQLTLEHDRSRETSKSGRTYRVSAVVGADGIGTLKPAAVTVRSGKATQTISAALLSTQWVVRWFEWERGALTFGDSAGWDRLFSSKPKLVRTQRQIGGDFSFKPPAPGIRTEYWAFEATTRLRLQRGTYRFDTLADDGIRVYVDGREVISGWRETPGSQSGQIALEAGVHDVRVRFCESWGHTYLKFAIRQLRTAQEP